MAFFESAGFEDAIRNAISIVVTAIPLPQFAVVLLRHIMAYLQISKACTHLSGISSNCNFSCV
jgi:hypothetical protein